MFLDQVLDGNRIASSPYHILFSFSSNKARKIVRFKCFAHWRQGSSSFLPSDCFFDLPLDCWKDEPSFWMLRSWSSIERILLISFLSPTLKAYLLLKHVLEECSGLTSDSPRLIFRICAGQRFCVGRLLHPISCHPTACWWCLLWTPKSSRADPVLCLWWYDFLFNSMRQLS